MNALFNRFTTINETAAQTLDPRNGDRQALLYFLIAKGTTTKQLDAITQKVASFVFANEEPLADLALVALYLELEYYLISQDPGYIGSKEKLREEILMVFPKISQSQAFLPLYAIGKNQEIVLGHYFLKYTAATFASHINYEKMASRWLSLLDTRSLRTTHEDMVQQIHKLRKLTESSREMYADFITNFDKSGVDRIFKASCENFTAYYASLPTIKSIKGLLHTNATEINSLKKSETNVFVPQEKTTAKKEVAFDAKGILENILDGFAVFDSRGHFLHLNKQAIEILGGDEKMIKNKRLFDFLPLVLSHALQQDLSKTDVTTPNKVIGTRHQTELQTEKDHSEMYELAITNNYSEETDSYSIFLKNITDTQHVIKNIEEAKLSAERTTKAKSTFLSNMSHEIRTPLNVILGLSEIIQKGDNLNAGLLQKNLDGINFSAKNLLSIVNDILDFSKIEAGKLTLQSIDFNLRKVVTNLADGFDIKAREKGLNLLTQMDTGIPEVVIGDQFRLNQILTNLIGNAIKFTQEGSITIAVDMIAEKEEEIELQFKVSDTGIGIPKEKLEHIFNSFYQVEDHKNSIVTGTGLGLTITKELIQLQNGVLEASSEVDKGSEFAFTLAFKKSKLSGVVDSVKTFANKDKKLNGLRVLVAEDNQMNQFYIKQLLNNLEVQVDIAENGKEAVEIFTRSRDSYDLIFMDMHMPIMNGIEAISIIRKSNKDAMKKIPIVACSADVFPEARKNAIKAGIDFYLTKPLNEEAVKEVLFWLISDEEIEPEKTFESPTQTAINKDVASRNIDIEMLQETFGNDEEFIISLLEVFIKITPEDYNSLRNCVEREFYSRASSLAHKMKSSFMNLGMTTHGHHLQQIETNIIRQEGLEEAKKHFFAFSQLYTKSLLEVNILLLELKQK